MALELIKTNRDHYNTILLTERYDDNILIDLLREACKENMLKKMNRIFHWKHNLSVNKL